MIEANVVVVAIDDAKPDRAGIGPDGVSKSSGLM